MADETPPLVTLRRDDAAMLLTIADLYAPHEHGTGKFTPDVAPVAERVREAVAAAGKPAEPLVMPRDEMDLLKSLQERVSAAIEAAWWSRQPASPAVMEVAAPAIEEARAAERDRIRAALAARKITLTRPGWGFRAAQNTGMVPWEAVAEVLGDGGVAAADSEALARVRHLGKCWAALPPGGGAGLPPPDSTAAVLREAGAELLRRIAGDGEPGGGLPGVV